MTAGVATARRPGLRDSLRGIRFRPAEGWLTLFATAVMVLVFAGSLIEAEWLPESEGDPRFLLQVALIGLAFGVIGAKLGWGRWRTHFVGALFAGLFIPLIVGGLILHGDVGWDPRSLAERLVATLGVVQIIWNELVVQGRSFTSQYAHYNLIFGALVWAAGMLAGFTVFGHRRPLDAIVVIGLAILANMALLSHDQLWLLVVFSASALLLLIRTHVFEEEITWTRRRIGEPGVVGELYQSSGALFVTVAIIGSVLLTFTASSAPLQGLWADLPRTLQGASQWFQKFAPPGDFRNLGVVGFGNDATTNGLWQPSDRIAFRSQVDPTRDIPMFRWRAGTYAVYKTGLDGWVWGTDDREPLPPNETLNIFSPQGDAPLSVGRRRIQVTVTPDAFKDPTILGPNLLESVDKATDAVLVGADGWYASLESAEGVGPYTITALIPIRPELEGGLNEARLRAAGRGYSTEMLSTYAALPPNAIGPIAAKLLADIKAAVPSGHDPTNPYDLARTMETYLRDEANFTYEDDVRDLLRQQCGGISTVECFATIRQGYCEYYASTMAVLLRQERIPARVVYGFLPATPDNRGVQVVAAAGAHWWVEVYFPGIGWFEFDPTGGGRGGDVQPLPSGSIGPATPRPTGDLVTLAPRGTRTAGTTQPPTVANGGAGPFIAIALILAIGIIALAYVAYRRVPTKPMAADQAWGSLARLAGRFGLGPKPSQTVYEYAGVLGDTVPTARVELTTLARAKVEVAYGKRDLGADNLRRIAEAYHRLRIALIGVVLRRGLRRRRRR